MYEIELDKQEWVMNRVSDLMYDNEFMEYTEALEKAETVWDYWVGFYDNDEEQYLTAFYRNREQEDAL